MLGEVRQIRALADETLAALRSQRELLQSRGMNLPPMAIQAMTHFAENIARLETELVEEQVELGQLRFLVQTSAMVNSSFNVNDVLVRAMDVIIDLTHAERGYIILRNDETQEFEFRVVRENELNPKQGGSTPQISQTILRDVLTTGQPLLTDNAYQDQRLQDGASIAQMVLRSVLCVPLRYKEDVFGVVYVDNRLRAGVFTDREKRLLTAFANQMSVAVENARLYINIQHTMEEIRQIKQLMDDVFASIGSGVVTTDITHQILLFNRAAEQILERKSDEVIGQTLMSVIPGVSADLNSHLSKVRADRSGQTLEAELQISRRRVALNMKLTPLRGAAGVAMVIDDMTAKKASEETLTLIRRYLPPEMVDNIHTISRLALGGEKRVVTCMFVDVRPVDTFPEHYSPRAIMEHMNQYLTRATDKIHRHKGMIDKYMGNVVMALFNSQLNPMDNHAARALEVALEIRESFLRFYDEQGINPDPHYYRIGIHTGEATLGNVGSLTRREFSAIGDTINLTKRLEENAHYGQIIVSENTLQHAQSFTSLDGLDIREHEPLQVKGRQQKTIVYEIFRA